MKLGLTILVFCAINQQLPYTLTYEALQLIRYTSLKIKF